MDIFIPKKEPKWLQPGTFPYLKICQNAFAAVPLRRTPLAKITAFLGPYSWTWQGRKYGRQTEVRPQGASPEKGARGLQGSAFLLIRELNKIITNQSASFYL